MLFIKEEKRAKTWVQPTSCHGHLAHKQERFTTYIEHRFVG